MRRAPPGFVLRCDMDDDQARSGGFAGIILTVATSMYTMVIEIEKRRSSLLLAGIGLFFASLATIADEAPAVTDDARLARGKQIATSRAQGNCLACHRMDDGELPGTIGPPLVAMKLRYTDRQRLREQIWDATKANPDSRMPPFGRHRLLTEEEIDLVTDYIYSL